MRALLVGTMTFLAAGCPRTGPAAPTGKHQDEQPADAAPAPVDDLAFFGPDEPPSTVGELETALAITLEPGDHFGMGRFDAPPLTGDFDATLTDDVDRVSVEYDWDMYHQDPIDSIERLRRQGLESYTVTFKRGRTAREAALRARYGEPGTAHEPDDSGPPDTWRVYGPFFVDTDAGAGFQVAWYRKTPDWAVPEIDAASRETYLRGLIAALESATKHDELVRAAASPPADAGVVATGPLNDNDYWLELKPPIPALDLAKALGWTNPVGVSHDTHMSMWHIELLARTGKNLDSKMPRVGMWEVEASLDAHPTGGKIKGAGYDTQQIGAKDLVRHIQIAPARP